MKYFTCLLIVMTVLYTALSLRVNVNMNIKNKNDKNFIDKLNTAFQSKIMKTIPAIVGTALLFGNPIDTLAASSGSRSGGSSFRSSASRSSSSYSSRPSTRLNAGSSYSVMPMPVMPMYGYGYGGFGFSPFSFIPINGNLLLLGGVAYIAYSLLKNRIGGTDFSNDDGDSGSLGSGATVIKLQLGLDSDWSQGSNIMDTLSSIAGQRGVVSGRSEIANLLSETSIALLRRKASWNSASIEGEKFNGALKAEPYFQKVAIQERTKFESETNNSKASNVSIREDNMSNKGGYLSSKPTQAVVSLIVAIRGNSDALKRNIRNTNDLSDCLQSLASEALTDEGENIMAVEVLWTPSQPGSVLTERELIMDYPELIKL